VRIDHCEFSQFNEVSGHLREIQRAYRARIQGKKWSVERVNSRIDSRINSPLAELTTRMSVFSVGDVQLIRPDVLVYPLGVWIVMAVVAVINGGFREVMLIPRVGEYAGHVLSTALLVAALLVTSFVYFQWTPIEYAYVELVVIGVGWTGLTIGFEFLVGYVEGTPVSVTLGQYNVLAGQVWIVVPLTLLLSPLLFGWYLS
jgi:hypothetical protein